jgi:hypothetical protein
MRRHTSLAVLPLALLAVGSTGTAGNESSLMPLADGNRWTRRDVASRAPTTISVRRRAGGFVLSGFPGTGELRIRPAPQAVEAWDPGDRRWEPFLRFGLPVRARYPVDLRGTALWRSVRVVVASKRAIVRDFQGRARRGCTRLEFRYRARIADAGLVEMSFAPRIGPVRFWEQTIAGPRVRVLAAFRVRLPPR